MEILQLKIRADHIPLFNDLLFNFYIIWKTVFFLQENSLIDSKVINFVKNWR